MLKLSLLTVILVSLSCRHAPSQRKEKRQGKELRVSELKLYCQKMEKVFTTSNQCITKKESCLNKVGRYKWNSIKGKCTECTKEEKCESKEQKCQRNGDYWHINNGTCKLPSFADQCKIKDKPNNDSLKQTFSALLEISKKTDCKELEKWGQSQEELLLEAKSISELAPLAYFTKLKILKLNQNDINNLSPLKGLINLEILALEFNKVFDLRPIEKLTKLKKLYLMKNEIAAVAPLKGLISLNEISLGMNSISDITHLENLVDLKVIDLKRNQIKDVRPLGSLPKLENLNIEYNPIFDEPKTKENCPIDVSKYPQTAKVLKEFCGIN